MVEPIRHKNQNQDYWKVRASSETKEEKHQQDQEERRDSFEESSDFIQLLSKDPRRYQRKQIPAEGIDQFIFRSVSTHREKATLEVDIRLFDGSFIRGAQVAISRQEGMRYLSRKKGDNIAVEQLIKGHLLTIAVPDNKKPKTQQKPSPRKKPPPKPWWIFLSLGGLIITLLILIFYLLIS